jgi:hypothetical protein
MVNFCGCCTRTDIVREHQEDTLRICDVSAMGLYPSFPIACLSLLTKILENGNTLKVIKTLSLFNISCKITQK